MATLCTYVLTKDKGLAPNPYWGYCTLAVCTPNRQGARLSSGDMIAGFRKKSEANKLIYAMELSEVLDMDEYFHDERFLQKRPDLRGNWKQRCGDNFYSRNLDGTWRQHRNRFHIGDAYLRKDTRRSKVFIGERYWYFGRGALELPDEFLPLIGARGIRVKHPNALVVRFREWLGGMKEGIHALPANNPDVVQHMVEAQPCPIR